VQGVGFRHYVRETARDLGLSGWVRNAPDGSVEVAADGPPQSTNALLEAVRRGPGGAVVEDVELAEAGESAQSTRPIGAAGESNKSELPFPFSVRW
jgi:acylphosphatase